MARVCGGCSGSPRRSTFRTPAGSPVSAAAAQAATSSAYEIIDSRGRVVKGRTFTSLVAASGYASRIGGTTRPKA